MIDDKTEAVLEQIFGRQSGWDSDEVQEAKMCPGFPDIAELARILASDPDEAALQTLLTERPQFLLGLFGQGDDGDVGFVTKPRAGAHAADFATFNIGQGGCTVTLVEIERSAAPLFTGTLTPARTLQTAMGQIRDWHQWLAINKSTFIRDSVSHLKSLPQYPERSPNGSFRIRSADSLEQGWREFGGYDDPILRFAIVIGRWANLTDEQHKRLLYLNRHDGELHQLYTYDQLARRAYNRPTRWP